jgi:hypothetical protein
MIVTAVLSANLTRGEASLRNEVQDTRTYEKVTG